MKNYQLTHLADDALLSELATTATLHRGTTATLLAQIAEVDARKLYLREAFPSMYAFCVERLRMSEETALRRIRVARTAHSFPAIFPAVADGRLNLTAVLVLAPHLTRETAGELLEAAAFRSKSGLEQLLAERFPRPDVPTVLRAVADANVAAPQLVPSEGPNAAILMEPLALEPVVPSILASSASQAEPLAARTRITLLSPGRHELRGTLDQETRDLLEHAQALLGHALPSSDAMAVLKRALQELVRKLEREKFAKCVRTRPSRGSSNPRYVPAGVRREVWRRDGGQCTYTSASGQRCCSRMRLEFDHVTPVAQGGAATATNLRLRCRAHNQYAAEQVYGKAFMAGRREQSERRAAEGRRAKAAEEARAKQRAEREAAAAEKARAKEQTAREEAAAREVMPWLRALGFNAAQARHGAEACAHLSGASLEDRVKCAAGALAPRCLHIPAPSANATPQVPSAAFAQSRATARSVSDGG